MSVCICGGQNQANLNLDFLYGAKDQPHMLGGILRRSTSRAHTLPASNRFASQASLANHRLEVPPAWRTPHMLEGGPALLYHMGTPPLGHPALQAPPPLVSRTGVGASARGTPVLVLVLELSRVLALELALALALALSHKAAFKGAGQVGPVDTGAAEGMRLSPVGGDGKLSNVGLGKSAAQPEDQLGQFMQVPQRSSDSSRAAQSPGGTAPVEGICPSLTRLLQPPPDRITMLT